MDQNETNLPYKEAEIVIVGKANDIMKNSINGYLYDAGGSYYVPYQ